MILILHVQSVDPRCSLSSYRGATDSAWLGLTDHVTKGVFRYQDNETLYIPDEEIWALQNPRAREHCVILTDDGLEMRTSTCDLNLQAVICQREILGTDQNVQTA